MALERALVMHIEEQDDWGEAATSSTLAQTYQDLDRMDDALRSLGRALEIWEQRGDQRNVGRVLNEYGSAYLALGTTDRAIEVLDQALAIHIALDNWHGEAVAHEKMGIALELIGEASSAAEHWHQAIELYNRVGDPQAEDVRRRLLQ